MKNADGLHTFQMHTSCRWNCLNISRWTFLTSSCMDFWKESRVSSSVRWKSCSVNDDPCASNWDGFCCGIVPYHQIT
jgi:hypothetical protein